MPNAILKNTREKNCTLDRFVSAFVQAFETCSDTVKKYKACSMREIRLEKEFGTLRNDKDSEVFNAWKELVGETQLPQFESSAVPAVGISTCPSAFLELCSVKKRVVIRVMKVIFWLVWRLVEMHQSERRFVNMLVGR